MGKPIGLFILCLWVLVRRVFPVCDVFCGIQWMKNATRLGRDGRGSGSAGVDLVGLGG